MPQPQAGYMDATALPDPTTIEAKKVCKSEESIYVLNEVKRIVRIVHPEWRTAAPSPLD